MREHEAQPRRQNDERKNHEMTIAIVLVHVFVCLFLIVVILLQAGRGQGLSWGVYGGSPQSILGTKTASFLTRLTTACAIIFLFTCIGLNIIETRKSRSLLAPTKPLSQIDFQKVKEALKEAQNVKPSEEVQSESTTDRGPSTTESTPSPVPEATPS